MKFKHLTRRSLLAGLASGVALSPFVPLLESHAQTSAPTRLIIFHTPHGLAYENWLPTGSANDWALSTVLEPLAAHKDSLTVVEGLSNEAAKNSGGKDHNKAMRSLLTGRHLSPLEKSGGISIDQEVAGAIQGNAPFRSIESGIITTSNALFSRGADQGLAPKNDPRDIYQRVFADFSVGDDAAAIEALRADRGHVIDVVRDDLDALRRRVGAADRMKLDGHLAAIESIEANLANLGNVPSGCVLPDEPPAINPSDPNQMDTLADLHIDLVATALACDLTRVASFSFQGAQLPFSFLGINDAYHDCCHQGRNPSQPLYEELTATSIFFAEKLARLLDRLAAVPEGDGTMLDNTLVVWCTFMADGGHRWDDMPITLAGRAGGRLRAGRFLQTGGKTVNDLWTTVAQLMGHEISSFGDPGYNTSPISGLFS